MVTFDQFLETAAAKREFVNVLFEERVFELMGTLQKLTEPLEAAALPHELVGGLAVFLHVENADCAYSSLTRDIDLMIRREDLDSVIRVVHAAGLDMLLYGETTSARNAVHLLFAGEKVKVSQIEANPELRPVRLALHGQEFCVIPIVDLLTMKLSSYRDKDRVHVRGMDAAGLITLEVEAALTTELQARLRHTRETE